MASTSVSGPFPRPGGLAVPSRASTVFLVFGGVAIGVYFLLPSTPQDVLYLVIGGASVAAVAISAWRMEHAQAAWALFAGGLLSAVIADAISTYYEIHLGKEPPLPSAADVFYLGSYPLLLAGIYLLLRELGAIRTRGAVLDALIVTVAFGTVQWVFFFDPTYHSQERVLAHAVDMAYPTMDLLMLIALTQLTLNLGWRVVAYELLVWSVVLWVTGDEIYGLSADNYTAGGWVDVFWLGSYVLWGAAALDPSAGRPSRRDAREVPQLTAARLSILAGALLTIPAVLLIEHLWPRNIHAGAIVTGASLLAVLVVVRFGDLVRAVDRARITERTANERLREVDRLKDEFVSTVSHELRTPLMSITGYVELARERADSQERGYLEVVERNATRLLALVSDLLFVARIQSGGIELDLSDVDLGEIADESINSARPQAAAAGIELRLESPAREVLVCGDRRRLSQVVDNLLLNAVKFSPPGGDVKISVGRLGDGRARIEVADHGIGVPSGEQDRLFERFFRSSNARSRQIPGTGLGLYISNSIVVAHGGSIAVRSAEQEGSSFVVLLPAVP